MDIIPGWELDLLSHINKQYGSQFVQGDLEFTIAAGSTDVAFRVDVKPSVGTKYYGEDYFIYHRRDPSKYFQGVPVRILVDGDTTLAAVISQLAETYGIEFNDALDFTDDTLTQPVSFAGSGIVDVSVPVADTSFIWTGAFDLTVLSRGLDIARIIQARDVEGLIYPTTKGKISLPLASLPVSFNAAAKAGAFNSETLTDAGATAVVNNMVDYGTVPDTATAELQPALIGAQVSVTASESDDTLFSGFIGTIETDNYSGAIQLRYTHVAERELTGMEIWMKYGPLGAIVASQVGFASLTVESLDATIKSYQDMMGDSWTMQENMIWDSLASDPSVQLPSIAPAVVGMIAALTGHYTNDADITAIAGTMVGVKDPDYDIFRKNTSYIHTPNAPEWLPTDLPAAEDRLNANPVYHPMPFLTQTAAAPASVGVNKILVSSGGDATTTDGAYLTQHMQGTAAPILQSIQYATNVQLTTGGPTDPIDLTGAVKLSEFTADVRDVITPAAGSGAAAVTAGGTVDIATYRLGVSVVQVYSNLKPIVTDKVKRISSDPVYIEIPFQSGSSTIKQVTKSGKLYPLLGTNIGTGQLVSAALIALDGFELVGRDDPLNAGWFDYAGTKAGINDDILIRGEPLFSEISLQDYLSQPLAYLSMTDVGYYGYDDPVDAKSFDRAILQGWINSRTPTDVVVGTDIAYYLGSLSTTFTYTPRTRSVIPTTYFTSWYARTGKWEWTETEAKLSLQMPPYVVLAAGSVVSSGDIDLVWNVDTANIRVRDLLQFPALTITDELTMVPNPSTGEGIWPNTNYVIGNAFRKGYTDNPSRQVYDWVSRHFTRAERDQMYNNDLTAPAITPDQLTRAVTLTDVGYYLPFVRDNVIADITSGFYKPDSGDHTPGKFMVIMAIKGIKTTDGSLNGMEDLLVGKTLHVSIDIDGVFDLGPQLVDLGNGQLAPDATYLQTAPLSTVQMYLYSNQAGIWTQDGDHYVMGQHTLNDADTLLQSTDIEVRATRKA